MKNADEVKRVLRETRIDKVHSSLIDNLTEELRIRITETCGALSEKAKIAHFDADVDESVVDISNRIDYYFKQAIWSMMIAVAVSDGPVNRQEARVLNRIFDKNFSTDAYADLVVNSISTMNVLNAFSVVMNIAMQLNLQQNDDAEFYDPRNDPMLKVLDLVGQVIMNADEHVSIREATYFAEYTALAHEKASDLHRRIQELIENSADSSEPVPDKDAAVATSNSTIFSLTPLDQCVAELHELVGLTSVKREVETLINLAKVFALRKEKGMPVPPISFHLVFTGNPGTGKTTVARIIAKIYGTLGLLNTGNFVEVDRSGLVGNFVGQTANKTKRVVNSAIGGVLFIDEAYSLVKGNDSDFGSEAIEVILKGMEDHRSEIVVIVAGYGDRMATFLEANPGLRSRFPKVIDFPDYSPVEMMNIFERSATASGYHLDDEARDVLSMQMKDRWDNRSSNFANARDVRNIFEKAISSQANRLATLSTVDEAALSAITAADLSH